MEKEGSQTELRTVLLDKPQWGFGSSLCLPRTVSTSAEREAEQQIRKRGVPYRLKKKLVSSPELYLTKLTCFLKFQVECKKRV